MIDARCPCPVCKAGRYWAEIAAYRHRAARAWPRGQGSGIGAYRVRGSR